MSDSITASNITNNSATLNYEADNSTSSETMYLYIFLDLGGNKTFDDIESDAANTLIQTRGIGPGQTLSDSISVTNLNQNSTYSFMWSATRNSSFDKTEVFRRRPLNPPGEFVTEGVPTWTDLSLANATAGDSYSDGVSADRATSYTLVSGMPAGLSLNTNNGTIFGTPTEFGSFSIVIDANNQYGSLRATAPLTVNPPAPQWTDQTVASPTFIDADYSDGVAATYATSYSISSGSLPDGLSLNTSTGAITGTPTTEETQNFTIQATNVTGTISTGLQIEVQSGLAPPTFTDDTLSDDLRVLISYSDSVSATDADSYAFSGDPIPGLSIDNSGNVTGTPTEQGTFDFDIDATNAAGTTSAPFSLTVKPGAKRFDGTDFVAVTTFKRYDGTEWVDVLQTKRYDGTDWVNADL